MGGFEVRVGEVDALSFRVSVAASDVRSAQGELAATSCIDTGDAGLTGALSVFQQVWTEFTGEAARAVDGTAQAIAAAATSYQQVDSTVMADPQLTAGFIQAVTSSSDDGVAQMLTAPLVGTAPPAPQPSGGSGLDALYGSLLGGSTSGRPGGGR